MRPRVKFIVPLIDQTLGRWVRGGVVNDHGFPPSVYTCVLGMDGPTKTDEFLEKFQTAFGPPPPSFSENHVALFFQNT